MKTHYENPFRDIRQARGSILEGNRSAAFFVSAMVASFCFVVFMVVRVGITNFESATNFNFAVKLDHFLLMTSLLFGTGFVFCLFVAIIPFAVACALADQFKIENVWFFIVGAGLTGILSSFLYVKIPSLGINEPMAIPPTYQEQIFAVAPVLGACGLIAGLAAVFVLKRTQRNHIHCEESESE